MKYLVHTEEVDIPEGGIKSHHKKIIYISYMLK